MGTEKDKSASTFQALFADVSPIKQDTLPPWRNNKAPRSDSHKKNKQRADSTKQSHAAFQFSDQYEAHFDEQGPLRFVKPGESSHEVKRLRRGEYPPDLILDLHGLNRETAKAEVAELIYAAKKEHCHCVCIVHGIGSKILKSAVPNWLVQHPDVLGFHQAPLEWGGKGALLVLIAQQI
ncbi:endonuclease SmrB [Aestuariibacter salexigens]|uniref:endonuclease SmrB n=1 Tax=Aestuariibacter salexigens TaxID=226010 RepID=UPI0003FF501E|nr:endonuclease SmrB [Aestuariibacter salexigens]